MEDSHDIFPGYSYDIPWIFFNGNISWEYPQNWKCEFQQRGFGDGFPWRGLVGKSYISYTYIYIIYIYIYIHKQDKHWWWNSMSLLDSSLTNHALGLQIKGCWWTQITIVYANSYTLFLYKDQWCLIGTYHKPIKYWSIFRTYFVANLATTEGGDERVFGFLSVCVALKKTPPMIYLKWNLSSILGGSSQES